MKARKARENLWFSFGLDLSPSAVSTPMMRRARGSSSTLGWSRTWCAARRIATRCAVLLNLPSCIFESRWGDALGLGGSLLRLALRAGADFPEKLPRVNAQVVVIVPRELNRVLAHAFCRDRFRRRLEHGQRAGSEFGRLSIAPACLAALFFAHGARAGVAQVDEVVMRNVAVFPVDMHASASGEIDLHRFRVRGCGGSLKRRLHELSIA